MTPPTRTTVPCEHCSGTGRRPLHPAAQVTLDALTFEWEGTAHIRRKLRNTVKNPALCNRLADLVRDGLAEDRVDPEHMGRLQYRRTP